ncbi:MAG TPA: SCO family protein [Methyloceanibacter sp.]
MSRRNVILIVACFLFGALLGAYALILAFGPGNRVESSGKALVGGPFALVDASGRSVTDQDFRGRYMLIFFGFTHCPDICPAELQVMAGALDKLGDKAAKVVPIFITLDPERDTPEAVGAYVKNFSANIVGLTGSMEAVAAAAKAYRVSFSKFQNKDGGKDYTIDHSGLAYLMGTDGEYITHIPYGTSVAQMVDILNRYL